jgi:catechol 2,3-dioxygenase-like lactoylglutathione lyase family enzyme
MTGLKAIRNIDYVILLCDDMGAAREFYSDVMGFQLLEDQPDWVRFRVGSSILTLRPRGPWLTWHDGAKPPGSAAIQLAFLVDPAQVDECHADLLGKGVEILDPPRDQDFGHRTLFFRDPDDNIIEIYAEI